MIERPPERWCPKCQMRWRVPVPTTRPREYMHIYITGAQLSRIRDAAHIFDESSADGVGR